jgi:hypothetical protein
MTWNSFCIFAKEIKGIIMRTKQSTKEADALRKEAQSIIIKRSGISIKRLYEHAINDFVANNIDLLTPEERKKYSSIILY